jgi:hypothetical protein
VPFFSAWPQTFVLTAADFGTILNNDEWISRMWQPLDMGLKLSGM